jgi:hypothetical protein
MGGSWQIQILNNLLGYQQSTDFSDFEYYSANREG